jgi:hypothetical protein
MMPHEAIERRVRYAKQSSFIDGLIVGVSLGLFAGFLAWVIR